MRRTFITCIMVCAIALSFVGAYTGFSEACAHNYKVETVRPATCTEGSVEREICTICKYVNDIWTNNDATGHTYKIETMNAATCTKGSVEQETCTVCKYINDAWTNNDATGHTYKIEIVSASTCTEGSVEQEICTVCKYINDTWTNNDATGHNSVDIPAVKPSCTAFGSTVGTKCAKCDEILTQPQSIPATGHTEIIDAKIEATCTKSGMTEGKHCSVCHEVLAAQKEIPTIGHHYATTVIKPTSTRKGYSKHVCIVCGKTYLDNYTNELSSDAAVEPTEAPIAYNVYGFIMTDMQGQPKDYIGEVIDTIAVFIPKEEEGGVISGRQLSLSMDLIDELREQGALEIQLVLGNAHLRLPLNILEGEALDLILSDMNIGREAAVFILSLAPATAPEGSDAISDAYQVEISISDGAVALDVTSLLDGVLISIPADAQVNGCIAMINEQTAPVTYENGEWTIGINVKGLYFVTVIR